MNPVTTGIPASPGSRARTSFRETLLVHPRRAEPVVGPEELPRVHVNGGDPVGAHAGGDQHRGEEFPEGKDPVARPEGALAEKLGPAREAPEFVQRRVEAQGEARHLVGRSKGVEKLPVHLLDPPRHRRVSRVPSPRKRRRPRPTGS